MLRYLEIKERLKIMIASKKNGEALPSRRTLAQMLYTSKATVDKAVRELQAEGFLSAKTGSGTFVSQRLNGVADNMKNWCLILPDISIDVYSKLAMGITEVAAAINVNVVLYNSGHSVEKQAEYIERLIMSGIDGFIIVPVITTTADATIKLYRSLIESKIPFVFCNRDIDGVNASIVKSNDFYGAYSATLHLIERGYRDIVFLARQRYRTSIDRCQGYLSALQHMKLPIEYRRIIVLDTDDEKDCYIYLKALLKSNVPVDGVFCHNDIIAVEAGRCVQDIGLRVSEDIGIIGYDDSDVCKMVTPQLTSVSYKAEDIGKIAARVLFQKVNGICTEFDYHLVEPEIVVRESCLGRKASI